MKCLATVLLFLFAQVLGAQQIVQTLVPQQPVSIGEAFQVQYVVYDLEGFQNLETPDFGAQFKVVSGPAIYSGNLVRGGRNIPVQNFSYTLIPLQKGLLTIAGATATYTHKQVAAPSVFIISNEKSKASAATKSNGLQPSLSSSNELLVKAEISKKECYMGEPVAATFTLVSKVVTAAEVIKNPGFYGFSVVEMPRSARPVAEGSYTSEFEQIVLRKVQLYPMQAGRLVIDEMTVHNLVQRISASGHVSEEEVILQSNPLTVNVKPLPAPAAQNFTGAVGRFTIAAKLGEEKLMAGRTGKLLVTLSGAGNFLQLPIPEVAWPQHLEGFEPTVLEDLQKYLMPISGKKQYTYNFTADSAGAYTIPPVVLTYFDPQTKKYNTVATDSLHLNVTPQKGFKTFLKSNETGIAIGLYGWLIIAALAIAFVLLVFWLVTKRKEKKGAPILKQPLAEEKEDYLQQLKELSPSQKDFKTFYANVQQVVLQFLKEEYGINAAAHTSVHQQLMQAPFTAPQKETLQFILDECERVQYYNAVPQITVTALQQKAVEVLTSLQKEN